MHRSKGSVDVVVIGAGFAGLTAATELHRRGIRVEVLEARDRVGGKTESQNDASGQPIDTGGQFVNDDMPNVLALIAAQGKRLVAVDEDATPRALAGGAQNIEAHLLREGFDAADRVYSTFRHLDGDVSPVGSCGEWLASLDLADLALAAARGSLSGTMCMSPDDIPIEHARDLAERTPLTRDELQYVVAETMHAVAVGLASSLPNPVRLNRAVTSVETGDGNITVRAGDLAIEARHVIVAVPPTAYRTMTFAPGLPITVEEAATRFRAGSVMKFMVGYDHAFWCESGAGSVCEWLDPTGLFARDASLGGNRAMLVVFLGGPASDDWRALNSDARRTLLLERLTEAYGPAAAEPTSFVERDWQPDEWGGGGYWNVLVDASAPDAIEVLRRGAPRITFASTELAPSFPGYIEGAITAGLAAAADVAERLTVS
jgi:monoamine oxidase